MQAIDHFRKLLNERRQYKRGTPEHEWRSRAARQYWWMHRKIAANQWKALLNAK